MEYFYDYSKWTKPNIKKMLDNIEIFEFETDAEAEAFRIGPCVVKTGKDFDEITPASYSALLEVAHPDSHKKNQRHVA